ncbi:MAG: hypothetical protein AVDCRST_MAG68-902, partial [uncultured Gemmatimonadetes bacterium]
WERGLLRARRAKPGRANTGNLTQRHRDTERTLLRVSVPLC